MNRFREIYFAVWATCLPIASFLAVPSIQGTIPGNLLALASIAWVPFLQREKSREYLKVLAIFAGVCIGLMICSQAGLYFFDNPPLPKLLALDPEDDSVLFRRSMITQSAYLVAGFLTCLFFIYCYRSEWRRYLFWGAWVLAIYGIYEWFFYLFMQHTGDFLANRSFLGGEHPGSWSQIVHFGGTGLLRIKSTTGEPSFLALSGMPYLILAIENRKWALVGALSFCLLFSLSTSAFLSLILVAAFSLFYFRAWQRQYVLWVVGAITVAVMLAFLFPNLVEVMFAQKLAGKGPSGNLRQHVYLSAWEYWTRTSFWNKFVGIGFGSAFVTPWLGGVLVNTGLIGVGLYFVGFLRPLIKLPNTPENWSLKASLLTLLFMLSVSVADFTYLTTWMTFGLAYRRLRQTSTSATASAASSTASETVHRRRRRRADPAVLAPATQAASNPQVVS